MSTLLGSPGLATRNKKLLGAPGRTTRNKDASRDVEFVAYDERQQCQVLQARLKCIRPLN